MKIGNLRLEVPVALAPMAGITDLAFRLLCKKMGCGLTVTEMISAKGLLYNNAKTKEMLRIDYRERPTGIQLFGNVPEDLARAARIAADSGADIIDFNMGCPVTKIVNNGEGSALMKNPELAYEILTAMTDAVKIPVTVKIRAGWNASCRNAENIAKLAERAGVAAIFVHGRTREQFYGGKADWQIIAMVKQAVRIPVFGNGDIFSADDGIRMLKETKCDGLMMGRGADGNPWIFEQLYAALQGNPLPPLPDINKRLDTAIEHLQMLLTLKGEYIAVREMRRHISAYLKGMPHAADYRCRFHQLTSKEEFLKLLEDYRQCWYDYVS